ncbi:protein MpRLK-Pelle_RKF3c [Marchantia polymorpha subsp. ruderalis]|uniref:non-specific serine/threonine protein kinase n=2 Tax=Marchantia polymorpha TaxID=3197 RepID=A0AAF6AZE2_MARPO|nr:hypothetical protein MARPO_0037s0143 [Marchantia polymorpha]BBN05126.1 hypothetical protein Mp_3g10530 [Marchantia polymorpha subsp. ruderalis]|eukprot:PTQ40978.1 hypothetical protein MARPO_0037s0143 [Marchantia polymorpha]
MKKTLMRSLGWAVLCIHLIWQLGGAESSRPGSRRIMQSGARLLAESPAIEESCPLDFTQLSNYPWVVQTCEDERPDEVTNSTACCNALLSAMGLAESQWLKDTGIFRLATTDIVQSCLGELQSTLEALGLDYDAVGMCFPEQLWPRFLTNNSLCLGIETASDFESTVGDANISSLSRGCAGDLTDLLACSGCISEMMMVYNNLNAQSSATTNSSQLDNETLATNVTVGQASSVDGRYVSDCFYDMILYTAAIATTSGPWSPSSAQCILAVSLTKAGGGKSLSVTELVLIGLSTAFVSSLMGCLSFLVWRRKKKQEPHRDFISRNEKMLKSARPNTGLIKYNYKDIKAATGNFSQKNLVGSGGFGSVYRGTMEDGLEVAVKRIHNCTPDGDADFLNELEIINRVRHRNLVVLLGCCVTSTPEDGHQRLLVCDFMPNGSLDQFLFEPQDETLLSWSNRRKIAVGMAKGLCYLHNDTVPSIIHRDIKPSNILLDENLNAKIADFGLARLNEAMGGQCPTTGRGSGTPGYLAPEYALYGQLTEKSDVYSFGVVLLELLTGRRALDPSQETTPNYAITEWVASMVGAGKVLEVVDERIRTVGPKEKMQTYVLIGAMCTNNLVTLRPTFKEILKYLEGELPLPTMWYRPMPGHRFSSHDWPDNESINSHAHSASDPDLDSLNELIR